MRLAIVGPGGSGKDEAANWLAQNTCLRYGMSTSQVIAPHVAARLGQPVEEAFRERHLHRHLWRRVGDELRAHDPAYLARRTLETGDLVVGIRGRVELAAVQAEGLVDLTLWIDRDVPADPTLDFGPDMADVMIPNREGIAEFHGRLRRLANLLGLIMPKSEVIN